MVSSKNKFVASVGQASHLSVCKKILSSYFLQVRYSRYFHTFIRENS